MNLLAEPELHSVKESARRLLAGAVRTCDFELQLLRGGKNNRVFRVAGNSFDAILKSYFRHPDDPRDRCATEFSFLSFAWRHGLRCVPEPLQHDATQGVALYEFVQGSALTEEDIGESAVNAAATFFLELNSHRTADGAARLNPASEACFSISAHLQCTQHRIDTLVAAAAEDTFEPDARRFIIDSLVPTWNIVREDVDKKCFNQNIHSDELINAKRRRLSPSDFGFHNAIKRPDGSLCFIDFEYAGWDDIAKTLCDFHLQPVLTLPHRLFSSFHDRILETFDEREAEVARMNVLMPVHQLKWCCIMMNDFLPISRSRRRFSLGAEDDDLRKSNQLESAKAGLQRIAAFA